MHFPFVALVKKYIGHGSAPRMLHGLLLKTD